MPDTRAFYDDLASYYDLIYQDWEATMLRQGDAILSHLQRCLPDAAGPLRLLDAAAGIGTQSLPLAGLGCEMTCRDLSPGAIERLRREAATRGLALDAQVADMRTVDTSVSLSFDAVLALDNAVPHLLSDEDVLTAFRAFHRALRPGGVCLLSVRDYDEVEKGGDLVKPYGVRFRDGKRHLPLQAWHWVDASHYDVTLYLIVDESRGPRVQATTARYYAIAIERLLALLSEAGFEDCQRNDQLIFQPVLLARRPR